jgi:glycopeptide antibiotics resistance protein
VLINIVGFIPLGFFLGVFLARRTKLAVAIIAAAATLGGAAISLFIELVQSQIPVRTSSVADLVSNTLGAGLGVLFFLVLLSHKDFLRRKESNYGQ